MRFNVPRFIYGFIGVLVVLPLLFYLNSIANNPALAISTVGTSSSINNFGNTSNRQVVRSSNGTILVVYDSGTVSPTGLVYRTSTDNAANWSSATQIDDSAIGDWDVVIDSSDNVYVVYDNNAGSVYSRKLTYSAGSWSVGTENTIFAYDCPDFTSYYYSFPSLAINSDSKLWVNAALTTAGDGFSSCASNPSYAVSTSSSTNGTSWTGSSGISESFVQAPTIKLISIGNSLWTVVDDLLSVGVIYKDLTSSGSWSLDKTFSGGTYDTASLTSSGSDQLDFLYYGSGIKYVKYTISTQTFGTIVDLTTDSSDKMGSLTSSSSGKLWAFYSDFVAADSYNVVYKSFNGSSWDGSPTSITTDNANNIYTSSMQNLTAGHVAIFWNASTSNPYTIKGHDLSFQGSPNAPTLIYPANNATGVAPQPTFQLRSSEPDNDYLKYKIEVCSTSNCSSVVRTIDQTSSQTGWIGQDQQSGTAYTGNWVITSSTIAKHNYQIPPLSPNTQYWWRAYAIDPSGTNTFSSASGINAFTTAEGGAVVIPGGVTIQGGTQIH